MENFKYFLAGGVGGISPTGFNVAASLVSSDHTLLVSSTVLPGLLMFFILGGAVALLFAEKNHKSMFMYGIAAPALIASLSAGTYHPLPSEKPGNATAIGDGGKTYLIQKQQSINSVNSEIQKGDK